MNDAGHALKPLLTAEGWELLNSLPPYREQDVFALNTRLREQGHSPETAAAALTQSRLRREAHRKFGAFAARMLFTEDGLQQSTRLPVAARHAQRFREASVTHVADLGSGLGGDAMAMASLGLNVVAVEADETTAAAATMNLLPFPEAEVLHTHAEDFIQAHGPLPDGWGLWLDPARRDPYRARGGDGAVARIWDPEAFSPPLSFVTGLAETGLPMGVKLGPGMPHELIPADCEAEWVSIDGDVVELVLWFNEAARPEVRRAASVVRTRAERTPTTGATTVWAGVPQGHRGPGQRPASETPQRDAPGSSQGATGDEARGLRTAELTSPRDFGSPLDGVTTAKSGTSDPTERSTDRALHPHDQETPEKQTASASVPIRGREGLLGTLWEPDGAVIRAGLVGELAAEFGGHLLDEHIAYFCTDQAEENCAGSPHRALAQGYRVLDVLDFNVKRLRHWVQAAGVTSLEIKKRGVDVTPETLRKRLLGGAKKAASKKQKNCSGGTRNHPEQNSSETTGHRGTLVLIRIGEQRVAAVVEPLPRPA